MARTPTISVSGEVLKWAREQRGLDASVAAKRLNISEEKLTGMESGVIDPSVAQLRLMSDKYKRPLIVLLLDEPPTTFTPLTDFRVLPNEELTPYSPDLRDEIRRAWQQQLAFAELKAELQEDTIAPALPESSQDAVVLGTAIRAQLGVTSDMQSNWAKPRDAFVEWRTRIEDLGILVLETSRVKIGEMRGFSLSTSFPYVIVLNGQDSERGKIFTMLHELAHLSIRISGVCDLHQRSSGNSDIEVFCNSVAGEALLPRAFILGLRWVARHTEGEPWTDEELAEIEYIAGGASREAILRRLLHLGKASGIEYEARRREFLEAYEVFRRQRNATSKGGPLPHTMSLRNRGRPFVRSVFEAYAEGHVTLSEVTDLVGVRTKHLDRLQRAAFS